MIDPLVLLAFIPASLALNLTPGADMMFSLGQGLRSGHRAALAASAGIAAGGMVHVTVAGLGLGTVVAAMPPVLDALRWIGVGYLLYLAWRSVTQPRSTPDMPPIPARRAFRSGVLVSLTNPKVILFVLAFIPQFLDDTRPVLMQFLLFGAVLSLGGFIINGLVGVFAGGAGRQLAGSPLTARALGWASGGIFAALAVRLAIMERA